MLKLAKSGLLSDYRLMPEEEITETATKLVLEYANHSATSVPAYKKFLTIHNYSGAVVDLQSFQKLPLTSKDEYLKKSPRNELVSLGDFAAHAWTISATSGSTGEPFYFPRDDYQDEVYAATAEAYLLSNFAIDKHKTLYIIAFPMGAWIGGVFTYSAINKVANKGYDLSIITPGINKTEIIRAVKNLQQEFDQIIIGSYAPFLKDILDDGTEDGIDWKDINVKFIFSAEAFSEEFRDYLAEKAGIDPLKDTLNHYGTVDLGTMAHETPYSIMIRRLAYENKAIFTELFNEDARTPTFAQYDPRLFFFEEFEKNKLYCTARTGYPLIRYDLKDRGGVRSKKWVEDLFLRHGVDLTQKAVEHNIDDTVWNLPFVFVYERSDFSVSYYAFQVYPEIIRKALLAGDLSSIVTGKFSMRVTYDNGRQILEIFTELRNDQILDTSICDNIKECIHEELKNHSSEYRQVCSELGEEVVSPKIVLCTYEDSTYFKPGTKQQWVIK